MRMLFQAESVKVKLSIYLLIYFPALTYGREP